jgi:hypothetical protein
MSCRDYCDAEEMADRWIKSDAEKYATIEKLRLDISSLKSRNDLLARIACKALAELETKGVAEDILKDKEVADWWAEHQVLDKKFQGK